MYVNLVDFFTDLKIGEKIFIDENEADIFRGDKARTNGDDLLAYDHTPKYVRNLAHMLEHIISPVITACCGLYLEYAGAEDKSGGSITELKDFYYPTSDDDYEPYKRVVRYVFVVKKVDPQIKDK